MSNNWARAFEAYQKSTTLQKGKDQKWTKGEKSQRGEKGMNY